MTGSELSRVFRPEKGKRIASWVVGAWSGLACAGFFIEFWQGPGRDPVQVGFFILFPLLALWFVRVAQMRIIASNRGIAVIDVLGRREFRWIEIDHFELREGRRGELVLRSGGRYPLIGQVRSPLERALGRHSVTDRLVEELNELLEARRGG